MMTFHASRRTTLGLVALGVAPSLTHVPAIAQPSGAREQEYQFASTPWGADERQVIRNIEVAGFRYRQKDADGDLEFTGRVMDHSTKIFAFISRQTGALTSVQVNIGTPDEKARDVFRRMRESLIAKYGQPSDDYAFFQKPYYDGDGFETQAIRQGKGHFASFWKGRNSGLMVRITDQLAVRVLYEGPQASGELRRRNAEDLKAF